MNDLMLLLMSVTSNSIVIDFLGQNFSLVLGVLGIIHILNMET